MDTGHSDDPAGTQADRTLPEGVANGPGAAAVLAAGIGSLALGVFAFAGDASPPIRQDDAATGRQSHGGASPRPPLGPRSPAEPRSPAVPSERRLPVEQHPPTGRRPSVDSDTDATVAVPGRARRTRSTPVAAHEPGAAGDRGARTRYPPAPPEQLSFEDPE